MLKDRYFMRKAIQLAKLGQGFTAPNPCVGAIIVHKGKIVGKGYHQGPGQAHAEVVALKQAKENITALFTSS